MEVTAKECIKNFKISSPIKFTNPLKIADLCSKSVFYSLKTNPEDKFHPRIGYIKSNLKGEYFVIYCDSCNAKCHKVYTHNFTLESKEIIKFLCFRCSGKKYKRRTVIEKRAFEIISNPEKILSYSRNQSYKNTLAILEAEFLREEVRENLYEKYKF